MKLSVRESGDLSILALEGSLDLDGANEIENAFMAEIGRSRSAILDFSGVTFIASFGMRLVIEAVKALVPKGGRVVILSPQPSVKKLLYAAGLDNVLSIAGNDGEARILAAQA